MDGIFQVSGRLALILPVYTVLLLPVALDLTVPMPITTYLWRLGINSDPFIHSSYMILYKKA